MEKEEVNNRRSEDRDRMLNTRLDQIEVAYQALSHTVSQLENAVNIVKLEQGHLKDLFSARLNVIEQSGQLQLSKIEQVSKDINIMGSEVEKTPMGRTIKGYISGVQGQVDEQGDKLEAMLRWKNNVEGVLVILKWVGAGGLVALGVSFLRLIKVLP